MIFSHPQLLFLCPSPSSLRIQFLRTIQPSKPCARWCACEEQTHHSSLSEFLPILLFVLQSPNLNDRFRRWGHDSIFNKKYTFSISPSESLNWYLSYWFSLLSSCMIAWSLSNSEYNFLILNIIYFIPLLIFKEMLLWTFIFRRQHRVGWSEGIKFLK